MTAIRLLSDCVHQKLTCAEKEQLVNAGPNKTAKRTCLNSCIGKKSMEIKAKDTQFTSWRNDID